jgi:hypothetical protein
MGNYSKQSTETDTITEEAIDLAEIWLDRANELMNQRDFLSYPTPG